MNLSIGDLYSQRKAETFELHDQHLNNQMVRVLKTIGFKRTYVRAKAQYLYDDQGDRYLDMLSGYGVFALGRNHPEISRVLKEVLDADLPNLIQMDCGLLSGLLAEKLLGAFPFPMDKIFFSNSGAEANEAAIKFSRAATRREKILYCSNAFHGLTTGALALNGSEIFREGFGSLLPHTEKIPFNDSEALEKALSKKDVAAFIVEPIQGKGVYVPSDHYFKEVAALCKKYGTLFVMDEVQTGLGRTGKFLASEHWGVEPDIVTVAKALSGGAIPVGAMVTKKWIWDKVYDRMDRSVAHSSTFSKNNLAMAAGLATLDVLKAENLVERARIQGDKLLGRLSELKTKHEMIKEVRGKGLMIGIEFGPPKKLALKTGWHLLDKANKGLFCQMITIPLFRDHRILCQVAGHNSYAIKFLPPLILADEDIDLTVKACDEVIGDAHQFPGSIWNLAMTLAGHAMKSDQSH